MRKTLILLTVLLLSLSLAQALSYTIPLNDYQGNPYTGNGNVVTFECTDSSCSNTNELDNLQSFSGSTLNYQFPTESNSDYFRIHIMTQDHLEKYVSLYVTRDLNEDYSYVRSSPLNLHKAAGCYAPIDTFTSTNRLGAGAPLVIKYATDVSASVGSPFEFFNGLSQSEKSSETLTDISRATVKVDVTIKDEDGNVVLSDFVYHRVAPNENKQHEYVWTPQENGEYSVILTSSVIDDKCTSTVEKKAGLDKVTVFGSSPATDVCYVRTQNFKTSQPAAGANGKFIITGDVYAYKTDGSLNTNNYEAIDAKVTLDFGALGEYDFNLDKASDAGSPIKFSQLVTLAEPVTDYADFTFKIEATPNSNLACSDVISETQTLDIRKSTTFTKSPYGLSIDRIPDAIISTQNKEYSVDLGPLTHSENDRAVSYYAYALGTHSSKFDVEMDGSVITVSLKQDDYYSQPNLANVYVTASDGENRAVRSFKVRTPSAIERTMAVAKFPEKIYMNTPVVFDASDSTAEEGNQLVKYTWEFGDNTPALTTSSEKIVHTYATKGLKILKLTIEDSKGNLDIATYLVEVLDGNSLINVEPHDVHVKKFAFQQQEVKTGDKITSVISFTNNVGKDLKNVRMILTIKELGLHQIIGPVKIDRGETWSRKVYLDVPEGTQPGGYWASLLMSNGEFYKHKYNHVRLISE